MSGVTAVIACTSRVERPIEFSRTFLRSSSLNSRSLTMTLRRPIVSMIRRLSFSAPAPIESMAITAPTPKIIPSIVRNVRSLWVYRLPKARLISVRYRISFRLLVPVIRFAFHVGRVERQRLSGFQPLGHDHLNQVALSELDLHRLELSGRFAHVDGEVGIFFDYGAARDDYHGFQFAGADLRLQLDARFHQVRIGFVERDDDLEVFDRRPLVDRPREVVDGFNFAAEFPAREGIERNRHGLIRFQLAGVFFQDEAFGLHLVRIDQVEQRRAYPDGAARLDREAAEEVFGVVVNDDP